MIEDKVIKVMIKAASEAGALLIKDYGNNTYVTYKKEGGVVSRTDKNAEKLILEILLQEYKYNVIAEESGEIENSSDYCWVIDPIDGTTNYLRQIPFFCVSIALLKNNKPVAAVIHQPLSEEIFYAEKDKGVILNGDKQGKNNGNNPTIIDCNLGYSDEAVKAYINALNNILPNKKNTRNFGSSALELAYVAAGRLDCFLSYGDELYDIAAGILLAQEAGCLISNWEGKTWNVKDKSLLVAPPEIHDEIKKYLNVI